MPDTVELKLRTIRGSQAGPRLLITGGVHGDEFEPMVAIRQLADRVSAETLAGELRLIPVVNESAYRRQHRCGDDGLDLARTCPGRSDGSITERIAAALTEQIRQADYYIDLHTGGTTYAANPLTGYMLHPDRQIVTTQRSLAKAFNLPIVWGTSAELEGRSLSVARDANVPAIYVEYLGSAVCDPQGVTAYVDGCLNVMGALGMIDRTERQPSRVQHVIEDDRPQSGHVQIQHPAPCDGFFAAHVQLGQAVVPGELLGVVYDELGEQPQEVQSTQAGIVLFLRTFPGVRQGEGLAVVLETDLESQTAL